MILFITIRALPYHLRFFPCAFTAFYFSLVPDAAHTSALPFVISPRSFVLAQLPSACDLLSPGEYHDGMIDTRLDLRSKIWEGLMSVRSPTHPNPLISSPPFSFCSLPRHSFLPRYFVAQFRNSVQGSAHRKVARCVCRLSLSFLKISTLSNSRRAVKQAPNKRPLSPSFVERCTAHAHTVRCGCTRACGFAASLPESVRWMHVHVVEAGDPRRRCMLFSATEFSYRWASRSPRRMVPCDALSARELDTLDCLGARGSSDVRGAAASPTSSVTHERCLHVRTGGEWDRAMCVIARAWANCGSISPHINPFLAPFLHLPSCSLPFSLAISSVPWASAPSFVVVDLRARAPWCQFSRKWSQNPDALQVNDKWFHS
ncbi:hypothetical protein B0H13DRAFT_367863 [Mycena leptocephala]|nr:hypothetical protein B0H13DRAFT_367863 [Mycena leptocephala]